MPRQKLELATEYPPADENILIDKLAELLRQKVEQDYPPGKTLRDAHPKQHGCVRGKFVVESQLLEEFKVGIFKEARSYNALIRFSNANPTVSPDYHKDVRGMAIKLLDVDGEKLLEDQKDAKTQDFIVISYDAFFTKDVKELYLFTKAFFKGTLRALWFFFNPFNTHISVFRNIRASAGRHTSPLDIRYWSMTPYMFGSRAVKYSVAAWRHPPATIPKPPTDGYLRENMRRQLETNAVYFDFMVQFQTDPYKMPIEDASVAWNERLSPFHKIATIIIPQQNFDTAKVVEFGENLSFTPWHSIPEHRPIGGINRCRKVVYDVISKFRHERNEMPRCEPAPDFKLTSLEEQTQAIQAAAPLTEQEQTRQRRYVNLPREP